MTDPPAGTPPLGAVLAGGASRRMGRTKALVAVEGEPMAARVASAASAAGCDPVVLVGGDPRELAPLGLRVVADLAPGEGPVGGVVTALVEAERLGARSVFVAACDLPWLTSAVVTALLGSSAATVTCARTDRLEPACAVWPTSTLDRVRRAFDDGVRSLYGLLDLVDHGSVPVDGGALRNINTPADLGR